MWYSPRHPREVPDDPDRSALIANHEPLQALIDIIPSSSILVIYDRPAPIKGFGREHDTIKSWSFLIDAVGGVRDLSSDRLSEVRE